MLKAVLSITTIVQFLSAGSASRPADQWPIWAQFEEEEEGWEKGHFVKIRHLEVREASEHR